MFNKLHKLKTYVIEIIDFEPVFGVKCYLYYNIFIMCIISQVENRLFRVTS